MNISSLSVIVPAYNEEKRIKQSLQTIEQYLKKRKTDYEIIVVDDCSKDATVEVVSSLQSDKIRIFSNNTNRGKGHSVRRGVLLAKKKFVLFSDADLSTPIEELALFEKFIPSFQIIIGSRNLKQSKIIVKQPKLRSMLGKIFPLLVNMLVLRGIKDTQCGFKLFSSEVARKIFTPACIERFSFDVEILYLAKKKKIQV
ncbi:glycosyl transferase, partial [Candidatus Woesearchaeota archaeon CG10_big_fil_rev_8_21_14_0_10_34_8]